MSNMVGNPKDLFSRVMAHMKYYYVFQVSVNSLDKAGSTPMHWAAHGGHIECMKALIQASNCNINVQVLKYHVEQPLRIDVDSGY